MKQFSDFRNTLIILVLLTGFFASFPCAAAVFTLPPGPPPPSGNVTAGDTVNILPGGSASNLFVFPGGIVNQTGGSSTFTAFRGFGQFDGGTAARASAGAFPLSGGTLNANGVSIVNLLLSNDATLNITADGLGFGPSFQTVAINSGTVNHSAGTVVGRIGVFNSSGQSAVLNQSGGFVDEVNVSGTDSIFNFSGGGIGNLLVLNGQAVVNFIGTDFTLGGSPLGASLAPGDRLVVSDRTQVLETTFLDGSTFSFDLSSSASNSLILSPDAEVAIVAVPEPSASLLVGPCLIALAGRRRRRA
jgi:hypothetical protein